MEFSIVSIFYINRMNLVQFLFLAVTIKSLQFQDDYYMQQELKEILYKKKKSKIKLYLNIYDFEMPLKN